MKKNPFGLIIGGRGKIEPEKMHNYVKRILESEKIPFLEFRYDEAFDKPSESNKDELYEEAKILALRFDQISASFLQTRLRIGFMRTARIIDQLKEYGIISEKKKNGLYDVVCDMNSEDIEKYEKEFFKLSKKQFLAENSEEGELYEEARMLVISSQKASPSFLQRKLRISYSRAFALMRRLEEKGIVSGRKPGCIWEVYYEIDSKGKVRKNKNKK